MLKKEIDARIKGLRREVTLKLGRCGDDVFLADTEGNIIVKPLSEDDLLHLLDYLNKEKSGADEKK